MPSRTLYSTGEGNAIIDTTLHPFSEKYPFILLLHGLLHGIVERDATETVLKFLKYSSPRLLEQALTTSRYVKPKRMRRGAR